MAKIMLVEDDNNLREIYEARLLAEGYDIVTARDGEEALAVAVKERPDLIISDVMMPKISGFDMLDILRSTPETKDVKVIMMTALSQAEDKERATKLGADRYLVKSQVTLEDVAKVAHEVLEGAQAANIDSGPAAEAPVAQAVNPEPLVASAPAMPAEPTVTMPAGEPVVAAPVAEPAAVVATTAIPITVTAPDDATDSQAPDAPKVDVTDLASSTVALAAAAAAGITDLNEPVAQAPVIVPVTMPDIERPSAEVWAASTLDEPTITDAPADSSTPAVAAAEAAVHSSPTQSLEEEEAAIAKQIESIIDTTAPAEAPAAVEPEAEEVATVAAEPAATEPETVAKPANMGEKVIQPINDPKNPAGPSIHELAAKEEALEQGHVTGAVIEPQTAVDATGDVDPTSLAL